MAQRSTIPVRGRAILKRAVRTFGVVTAGVRPLPDFLIIGTKRGGTTSFYFDLIDHQSIVRLFPPPIPGLKSDATKGVHFFDSNFGRGLRWYKSYMPTSLSRGLTTRRFDTPALAGEASPYYLFHPDAARRAHSMVPDARLVVLLRDPAQRAYSHWKERRRSGAEDLDFIEALDAEPARLAGERERLLAEPDYYSYAWEQQSYVTQSRYATSLRPWIEHFGLDRLLVVASEDYYREPLTVLQDVDRFLGLPPRQQSSGQIRNAAPGDELRADIRSRLASELSGDTADLVELVGKNFPWS